MPSWLSDLVGTDMAPLAYYALVAAIVLALIVIVLAVAKKAMGINGGPKMKGRGPRLAVLDVSVVDPKRKLVLVRRDEVEHLLLIGGQNDLVVEAGILRGAARQARVEPTIGAEGDQGMSASRGTGRGTGANGSARGPSPLTRPVPRLAQGAAPAAAPTASQGLDVPPVVSPAPDLRSEPVFEAPRPTAPAIAAPVATSPVAPSPVVTPPVAPASRDAKSSDTATSVVAEPRSAVPAVEPVSPVEAPVPRETAPVVTASVATTPVVPASEPSLAPSSNETSKAAVPVPSPQPVTRSTPSQVSSPSVAVPSAPAPASAQREVQQPVRPSQIDAASMPRPIPREPERPTKPAERAESGEQKRPALPVLPSKFSVGGSLEPVQRSGPATSLPPTQSLQPFQPRSMATPTLPLKPTTAAAELEAKATKPEPRTGELGRPSDTDIADRKPIGPEPSPEEVLARLLAKAKEPVHPAGGKTAAPSMEAPEVKPSAPAPAQTSAVQQPKVEPTSAAAMPAAPPVETPESGDRRPLSVRSFASAIQGRQSSTEATAPSQTRRDPDVAIPASSAPVTAPREPAPVAPRAQTPQPATSWEDEEDDIGDFLSAQLNDELGEDIWATKETIPAAFAPAVEPQEPAGVVEPEKPAAPIEQPTDGARAPAPAKRALTLEEEMERLLGDFDLETSDRRIR